MTPSPEVTAATPLRCAIYARVSTEKQAEKDLSLPAQLEAMRDYAKQRGWTIVCESTEPGASAKTADRPVLQGLLSDIRKGTLAVDVLLVHKIDRFARNTLDYAVIKASLKQHGVRLQSVVENAEPTASGELVENIMAAIAEFYSGNLSEEVKKGMRQKVLQGGWPHRPPRGYAMMKTAAGPVVEVHPTEGPLMKRAFELYASGWYSVQRLSERLAKDGLRSQGGRPISHAHLRRLLDNAFYVGRVRWQGQEFPGEHPVLIPAPLFERVREVTRARYKNPGPKGSAIPGFPLRGLAVCASCRGRMTSERHGRSLYYRCSRQTYRRSLCPGKACNATRAHATLEEALRRLAVPKALVEGITLACAQLVSQRAADSAERFARQEREGRNLFDAEQTLTRAFTRGDIAPNVYTDKVRELKSQREQLALAKSTPPVSEEQLTEHVGRTLQFATSLHELYQQRAVGMQATLLRHVFAQIVLDHDGLTGFVLRAPFDTLFQSPEDTTHIAAAVVASAA